MTRRYLSTPRTRNPWRTWEPPDHREPWQHRAACRGDPSRSWFTQPRRLPPRELERLALACRGCGVRGVCFMAAVGEHAQGVSRAGAWWTTQPDPVLWAGLWLRERRLPSELFRQQAEDE